MDVIIEFAFVVLTLITAWGQNIDNPCKTLWTFHEHTVTCMRLFETHLTFTGAKKNCSSYIGGPSGHQQGWLVAIYDETTDKFVQSLVKVDQRAFIGLSKNGDQWVWDGPDPRKSSSKYWRWKEGSPVSGYLYSYDYVAITKDGWETVTSDRQHGFVCQMFPDFPASSITCPPSEEGKPFIPMECRVSPQKSYGFLDSMRIYNDVENTDLYCQWKSKTCVSDRNLPQTEVNMSLESGKWKTAVTLKTLISRADNGARWSCSAEFEKTLSSFLTASCTMQTFVIPKTVECNQTVSARDGVSITCNVDGVFPRASSIWTHIINGTEIHQLQPHQTHKTFNNDDGQEMFFSVLASGQIATSGQHLLEITVYPDVQFNHEEARHKASIHRTVKFTIFPPEQFPVFSTENDMEVTQGHLTVEEGQAVTVICEVHGGSPHVSQTFIQCDGNHVRDSSGRMSWTKSGAKVSVKLVVTKDMDQKVCTCKARHVSNAYHESASLTLNVLHAVEIESFKINEASSDKIDVSFGKRASFRCKAEGNPAPELHLYKYDGYSMTELEPTKFTKTSISFHIAKSPCDASGLYMCSAKNSLNSEPIKRQVNFRVKCPPQSCSNKVGDREFSILPGKELNFKLCIFAYPNPHSDIRISKLKDYDFYNLNKNSYSAKYTNTSNLKTKGYVAVRMSPSVTHIGNYTIDLYQSKRWNRIDFSLVPYQVPSCPRSMDISLIGSRFFIVSWQPAFDRGIPQIFTLTTINDEGFFLTKKDAEDEGETTMLYNSTGLNPRSTYRLKLDVRNEQGLTECPHLTVKVTTKALKPVSGRNSDDGGVGAVVGAVVTIIVVLVIIAGIVIALSQRKRRKQTKLSVIYKTSEDIDRRQFKQQKDEKGQEAQNIGDLYATVNKPKKSVVSKQDNIYNNDFALEMHENRSRSNDNSGKTSLKNNVSITTEISTYANTAGLGLQNNRALISAAFDDLAAKTNNEKSFRLKDCKTDKQSCNNPGICPDNSGLLHDEQRANDLLNKELVYVEVEAVPQQEKVQEEPKEFVEPVDYAALNFDGSA
ncbi:hemicentin-1-like [Elysia marginata]|uniref:Hemicentin-1-like n=1 Tax=Elysia marginata TaxID=1093978 RepID=A0AAV4FM27_9GAST|nr:hemicentin-1-like [Elysia marginata]